jgi:hypothetical protein
MKFDFSRQIFEKYSDIKFHENTSSGGRVVPCRQTDRHDEANNCFSQLCKLAWQGFNTNSFLSSQPSRQSALTSPSPPLLPSFPSLLFSPPLHPLFHPLPSSPSSPQPLTQGFFFGFKAPWIWNWSFTFNLFQGLENLWNYTSIHTLCL